MTRYTEIGGQQIELVDTYNQQPGALAVSQRGSYASELVLGNIPGRTYVSKFGEAPSGVQTDATDIWSRADATPTQQIWLAPTAARQHALVSSSAADTFVVQVRGLTSWTTAETSENVTLTGQTPVNTVNSYVIIHRMKCIYTAAKTTNAGTITATAAAPDSTVTAVILPGDGQTEMAIYGVPSVQKAIFHRWTAGVSRATAAVAVNFRLLVNETPNVQTVGYLRKDDMSLVSTGANAINRIYSTPPVFAGPCIIKIQATATAADTFAHSGFDLEMVTV